MWDNNRVNVEDAQTRFFDSTSTLRARLSWTLWHRTQALAGTPRLHRIVSMLMRLIARSDVVAEPRTVYNVGGGYAYRDTEYEYEYDKKPEPGRAPKDGLHGFTN